MQAEEVKRIRNTLGLTQAHFAELLGVSRKQINEYEASRARVDRRSALAMRQIYNERSRLFSSHAVREMGTDVALADAMVLWDCDVPGKPAVLVVAHPDGNDADYTSSAGACSADWEQADDIGRLLRLFGLFVTMTVQDGYDPAVVHRALSVIPAYRNALHRGMFTVEEVE